MIDQKKNILDDNFLKKLFLFSFFPIIFSVVWLFLNKQIPLADSSNYLLTSYSIYKSYLSDGILHGLMSSYSIRGFRPIAFPILTVPYLIMTHGNVMLSFSMLSMTCLLASLIYIYLLFRTQLEPTASIIATNLIGLLPLFQQQILGHYAEAALFPCLLALVYHLQKSYYLTQVKQVAFAIIGITIAFMMRPIEAMLHIMPFLFLYITIGYYKSYFKISELITSLFILSLGLYVFIFACGIKNYTFVPADFVDQSMLFFYKKLYQSIKFYFIFIASLYVIYILLFKSSYSIVSRARLQSYLIPFFLITTSLILAWYLPFARETFDWVYRTSFGDIAISSGVVNQGHLVNPQAPFINELVRHSQNEGVFIVISMVVLSIINFISLNNQLRKKIVTSSLYLYLISLTIFPFFEIFFTVQDWPRKVSAAFPILLMVCMMISLQGPRFLRARLILFTIIAIVQFSLIVISTFFSHSFDKKLINLIGYYVQHPDRNSNDRYEVLQNFLNEQAKKYNLKNIALEINPNTIEPVDPFLMQSKNYMQQLDYRVGYPYLPVFDNKSIEKLLSYDAVLISAEKSKLDISPRSAELFNTLFKNENNPSIKLMYFILHNYSTNKLSETGLKVSKCITVKKGCLVGDVTQAIREADCLACLLLPVTK